MKKILFSLSLAIVSLFAVSQVDVRASIKGNVTDSSGPVSGAEVVVVYTPTGSTDRALTNADGAFIVNNLAPGGPYTCLLYTSPSPRDRSLSRMPSSA